MNAHRLFATAVCVASLSICSGTLYALDSARDEPASMRLASDERAFMKGAAASGAYQLATSKVALSQARSPEVKELAAKFAQDYAEVNSQLQKLAASKHYKLPETMSRAQQKSLASLSARSGQGFDRNYVTEIGIDRLKGDIKACESAARSSRDADLKAWAAKTVPVLQQHLAMVQAIRPTAN